MSVFSSIVSAIFNKAKAAGSVLAETISAAANAATGASKPPALTREQAEEMIQKIADATAGRITIGSNLSST